MTVKELMVICSHSEPDAEVKIRITDEEYNLTTAHAKTYEALDGELIIDGECEDYESNL